jgi:ribonuclease G
MLGNQLTLKVNPAIAELLHGEENALVDTLEKTIDKQIVVYPNSHFHLEEFEIYEVLTN